MTYDYLKDTFYLIKMDKALNFGLNEMPSRGPFIYILRSCSVAV